MQLGEGLTNMPPEEQPVDLSALEVRARSRSVGEILIDAGRLNSENATAIATAQKQHGLRFGEAGIALGLLTLADIEFALARQFEYPYLPMEDTSVSPELVAAYRPFGPVAEQVRSLRSRLMMRQLVHQSTPRSVAIVSAVRGEGRSFLAANLAVVFSQMGERTLLIDADLRQPSQHRLFKLDNRMGLSNILVGRADLDAVTPVRHFFDLSVLTAGTVAPNPQELLSSSRLSTLLRQAANAFDVVILDTPPAGTSADAQIIAARTGYAVLVARANVTDAKALQKVRSSLRESGANVIGTILNGN